MVPNIGPPIVKKKMYIIILDHHIQLSTEETNKLNRSKIICVYSTRAKLIRKKLDKGC